ncbi:hypothetical protein PtB15_5B104 [Puccinia triticina]|nr:hypothetical protein PtB15_5B104 [Puccinia triticina]
MAQSSTSQSHTPSRPPSRRSTRITPSKPEGSVRTISKANPQKNPYYIFIQPETQVQITNQEEAQT